MIFGANFGLFKIKSSQWIIAILIILFCNAAYAQDSKEMYYKAIEAVKLKDSDSAFMYFQLLLKDYPESKYKQDALFATGEYYFAIGDYRDAKSAFLQIITDHPDYKGRLFAFVYLLKMAEKQAKESLVENLENKIATFKQQIFMFKDYKEYKYKSPFSKKYKVVYSIDKVQFYLDGELFAQISY